ncbi:hypothetical protein AVEN_261381-1, partial [Araneus ventricosus]
MTRVEPFGKVSGESKIYRRITIPHDIFTLGVWWKHYLPLWTKYSYAGVV